MTNEDHFTSLERKLTLLRRDLLAMHLHAKTFGEYKNKFNNRDIFLIASGPTLNKFTPIPNAIYVGVNSAFQYNTVKLDFLFIQDYGTKNYLEAALNCNAVKFYGILDKSPEIIIPESVALRHNARRYYTNYVKDPKINQNLDMVYDITAHPLTDYNSVVFSAMQFILYTNPKKIYLVGCDSNMSGYFDTQKINHLNLECVITGWHKIKEFADIFYPETKIISINPVGLKGIFEDIYTKDGQFQ